jgi:hypothetical protein
MPVRAQTPPARPSVKTTVVLDADTHTKLVAAAALRGVDRSTYAAGILREGLKGVVCFDKALSNDPGESDDRPSRRVGISPDASEDAA